MTKKELLDNLCWLVRKLQANEAGGDAVIEIEASLETCDSVLSVVGASKGKVYIFKGGETKNEKE